MTEDDNAPATDKTAAATDTPPTGAAASDGDKASPESGKDATGKAIWMGSAAVGIGSAALVAALLYARRRK